MTDISLELAWPFPSWPGVLRYGLVFTVPVVFGAVLFRLARFEMQLVTARVALGLLALRLTTIAVILITLFFEPSVSKIRREDVPGRILIAVDTSDSMRVTDPQRPMVEKLLLAKQLNWTHDISGDREVTDWIAETSAGSAPSFADTPVGRARRSRYDAIVKRIDDSTRLALAERILLPDGSSLLDRLKSKHTVELVGADQTLVGLPTDPARLTTSLDSARPQSAPPSARAPALTDLKLPLARAGESSDKLLAVILLTDGRHNRGDSPQQRANELAARGVPIYPVAMAPRLAPPDVSIVAAKAQAPMVFKGDQEELLDLSTNYPLLEELATITDGKVYTPETIDELIERLRGETAVVEHRTVRPFRQSWWVLGLILGLLTVEWSVRKWNGLA